MDNILIKSVLGTMYSGEKVCQDEESEWLGVKPSQKSDIRVFMNKKYIDTIYHIDGTIEKLDCKMNKEQVYAENDLLYEDGVVLIRVKGGLTYRGKTVDKIMDFPQKGYWISPTTIDELLFYIPNKEVEEMFYEI